MEPDITVVACGVAVGESLDAAALLAHDGLRVRVVGVLRLKPLPERELLAAIGNPSVVVTLEEHNILGGLGSAVAECLAEAGRHRVVRLGITDRFTETGTYQQLLERYGVASQPVAKKIHDAYARLAAG
jgi:transketolase